MTELVLARATQIEALCTRCGVHRLDVFGSAATGEFDPISSDVDFVVEFQPLPPGARADAFFTLLEGLENVLNRPVDLVVDRAIRNPHFREAVNETRRVLYAT